MPNVGKGREALTEASSSSFLHMGETDAWLAQSTHLDPGRIPPGSVWRVDALGHDALGAVRNSPALTEKIIVPGDRDRLDHAARNMGERASAVRKQSSP